MKEDIRELIKVVYNEKNWLLMKKPLKDYEVLYLEENKYDGKDKLLFDKDFKLTKEEKEELEEIKKELKEKNYSILKKSLYFFDYNNKKVYEVVRDNMFNNIIFKAIWLDEKGYKKITYNNIEYLFSKEAVIERW